MNNIFDDQKISVFVTGTEMMLAQTPLVHSLNRVSVVSCYRNVSARQAIFEIYSGIIDKANKESPWHFGKGWTGHLTKEIPRVGFKVYGIVLYPRILNYYQGQPLEKVKADLTFAGSLACAEMAINPADTLKTMWQAGERIGDIPREKLWSHLYRGSLGNGLRQFGTWLNFPLSERVWSNVIDSCTPLDSHSILGIVVKSFPQSFQITGPVWIFERLKNELQYHAKTNNTDKANRYVQAFKQVLSKQGWMGLTRGFMPKVLSNWILIAGADYLLEQGRALHKK